MAELPPCTGIGTGSAATLDCGMPGPSYPTEASCRAGLTDTYEPVKCPGGRWHHVRRATVTDTE